MTDRFSEEKEDPSTGAPEPKSGGAAEKKTRSKSGVPPQDPNLTPPSTESKETPPPRHPRAKEVNHGRHYLYSFLTLYAIELVLFLAIIFNDHQIGCLYQQLSEVFRAQWVNMLKELIGGILVICVPIGVTIIKTDSIPRKNSLMKFIGFLLTAVIPCIIFLVYFLTISTLDKDGNFTNPKCLGPIPGTSTITLTPTQIYTSSPLPAQTVTLVPSPTQTVTSMPSITQTVTPVPSLTPTLTPEPQPVCIDASIASIELITGGAGWQSKTPDKFNHIQLEITAISGLTSLVGRAKFTDPAVIATCACSWFRTTEGSFSNKIKISTASNDCSFSTPLSGAESFINLYLQVGDGGPLFPFVIEFK